MVKIVPFYRWGKLKLIIEVRTPSNPPLICSTQDPSGPGSTSCVLALSCLVMFHSTVLTQWAVSLSLQATYLLMHPTFQQNDRNQLRTRALPHSRLPLRNVNTMPHTAGAPPVQWPMTTWMILCCPAYPWAKAMKNICCSGSWKLMRKLKMTFFPWP